MKKIKENIGSIVLCIMEILTGTLLLINPIGFTASIIVIVGIILTISGIGKMIQYFRTDEKMAALSQGLAKGLFFVVGGVFCIVQSKWFIAAFPVLTILYGVVTLLSGLFKVQVTVDLIRFKQKKWGWAAFSAALTLLASLIIIMNPFSSTIVLWTFTGIALIVEAIFDMVSVILAKNLDEV